MKNITLNITEDEFTKLQKLMAEMPGYGNATLEGAAQIVFHMGLLDELSSLNARKQKVGCVKTETKHTPGPWVITTSDIIMENGEHLPDLIQTADGSKIVVQMCGLDGTVGSVPEMMPNARLISAAPEMLEACKHAILFGGIDGHPAISAMLKAAIAKAEGLK